MAIINYEQSKFQFELIPASCSGLAYRDFLGKYNWDKLKKIIKEKAGYKCELCGVYPNGTYENRLEVHEFYSYDDENNIVSLSKLITVCNNCHRSIHYFSSSLALPFVYYLRNGKLLHMVRHIDRIKNLLKMSEDDIIIVLENLFKITYERSLKIWQMDHTLLKYDNINYHRIPNFNSKEISKHKRDRFIIRIISEMNYLLEHQVYWNY